MKYLLFQIKQFLRASIEMFFAFIIFLYTLPMNLRRKKIASNDKLLIVKFDALGDFAVFLDFVKGVKEYYPNKTITFLGNSEFNGLLDATKLFDDKIIVNLTKIRSNPKYLFSTIKKLKKEHFDIAMQTSSAKTFYKDVFFLAINAKTRATTDNDALRYSKFRRLFTNHWYDIKVKLSHKYLVDKMKNAEFLRGLGYTDFKAKLSELPRIEETTGLKETDYTVICPCSFFPTNKEWETARFAEIVRYLFYEKGTRPIIAGTAAERERKAELFSLLNDNEYIDMMGKTSILQYIALIQKAKLVIGNDSSSIHIAAASEVQSICIMNGFNHTRAFPYKIEVPQGQEYLPHTIYNIPKCRDCVVENPYRLWRCTKKGNSFPCVNSVTVQQVIREVDSILG